MRSRVCGGVFGVNWNPFRRQQASGEASTPPGTRIYAVGDIHGRLDLLNALLALIESDSAASPQSAGMLIFIGDYVDRGPDSRGVIDRLLGLRGGALETVFIRGNHDQTLLDFLENPDTYPPWREFGGQETLLSYGVMPPRFDNPKDFARARDAFVANCPPAHRDFLQSLPHSFACGDYLFAHAGVRPGVRLDRQDPHDLLWIRDEFLLSDARFGKVVVHGHTPAAAPVRRPNRIGIDTGAYATGHLTAAVLAGTDCRFLTT